MNALTMVGISCALTAGAAAQVGIEAYAPENSYLVVSAPDASAMLEALDRSSLRALWDHPRVQAWFDEAMAEGLGELEAAMDELGIDINELKPPTGHIGMAYFFVDEVDEEGESWPTQRGLLAADFGENADAIMDAAWALFDEWSENDEAVVTEDDYRDGKIIGVEWTIEEMEEPSDDADWEEWEAWYESMQTPLSRFSTGTHIYVGRLNGLIVASDEEDVIERVIDAAQGDDVPSVGDGAAYRTAVSPARGGRARVAGVHDDRGAPGLFRRGDGVGNEP